MTKIRARSRWYSVLLTGLALLLACSVIACQPKPPAIVAFNATPPQINLGEPTTLKWVIQDATIVNIDQGIGEVVATGSIKLSPTKTIAYTLTATNAGGTVSKSVVIYVNVPTVAPPPAAPPPPAPENAALVITNISASLQNETTFVITWVTNEPSSSQIDYGKTTNYDSTATSDEQLATAHSITLSNLEYNTIYHYRVKSKDRAENTALSGDQTFTTPPPKSPYSIELQGTEWARKTETFDIGAGKTIENKFLFIKGTVRNTSRLTLRGLICTMNCWNGKNLVKFETSVYASPILSGNSYNFNIQTTDDPTIDNVTVEFADPLGKPLIPIEK